MFAAGSPSPESNAALFPKEELDIKTRTRTREKQPAGIGRTKIGGETYSLCCGSQTGNTARAFRTCQLDPNLTLMPIIPIGRTNRWKDCLKRTHTHQLARPETSADLKPSQCPVCSNLSIPMKPSPLDNDQIRTKSDLLKSKRREYPKCHPHATPQEPRSGWNKSSCNAGQLIFLARP